VVNLPTHETRGQRYVALLRERFGPDAADRAGTPHDPQCRQLIDHEDPCTCSR
jgi:hypothetical protein